MHPSFEPGDQGLRRHTALDEQVLQSVEEFTEDRTVSGEQRCSKPPDDEHKILRCRLSGRSGTMQKPFGKLREEGWHRCDQYSSPAGSR
jgi:hypothetical protein